MAESVQKAKNVELGAVRSSQAEKITELEMAYADLKREKGSISVGYQRLFHKHKTFTEKAEQEKAELLKATLRSLLSFEGTWIWRLTVTRSTA
jgi:hypothetical protein